MPTRMLAPALAAAVLAGPAGRATHADDTLQIGFEGPTLPEPLGAFVTDGWSYALADDLLVMEKDAAFADPGVVRVTACGLLLEGDFTVTTRALADERASGALGLVVLHPASYGPLTFSDVFITGGETLTGVVGTPGTPTSATIAAPRAELELFVQRTGALLRVGYVDGAGFVTLVEAEDPVLAEPCGLQLFHLDSAGTPGALSGAFDFLAVQAEAFGDVGFDVRYDGTVDFEDLLGLLASWGPCAPEACCLADFDRSGAVGFDDLLALLANWD